MPARVDSSGLSWLTYGGRFVAGIGSRGTVNLDPGFGIVAIIFARCFGNMSMIRISASERLRSTMLSSREPSTCFVPDG